MSELFFRSQPSADEIEERVRSYVGERKKGQLAAK